VVFKFIDPKKADEYQLVSPPWKSSAWRTPRPPEWTGFAAR
jgi:hypothetical protein